MPYKVGLYKLSNKNILEKYINSDNNFNLIYINDINDINDDYLLKQLDVFLIDINSKISKKVYDLLKGNFVQIIEITDKPISAITNTNIILSFNEEIIEEDILFLINEKQITHIEYSINILKKLIPLAHAQKLRHTSIDLLDKKLKEKLKLEQEKYYLDILVKLIYLINTKDENLRIHSENVSKYAMLLGKELSFSREDLGLLKLGGILHDIGKLGISLDILNKREALSDKEFELMKKHPIMGEAFLPKNSNEKIKQIIRHHHERIDGKGYPDKLKGNDIPYFARIISIADAFDAMTTKRSYNKSKTLNEAIEELYRSATPIMTYNNEIMQQLDSNLVDIFIKALRKDTKLMEEFRNRDVEVMKKRYRK